MALDEIFAALDAAMPFGTIVGTGAEASQYQDDPLAPRVIWVPLGVDYGAPQGQGGDTDIHSTLPAGSQPPILTR